MRNFFMNKLIQHGLKLKSRYLALSAYRTIYRYKKDTLNANHFCILCNSFGLIYLSSKTTYSALLLGIQSPPSGESC